MSLQHIWQAGRTFRSWAATIAARSFWYDSADFHSGMVVNGCVKIVGGVSDVDDVA